MVSVARTVRWAFYCDSLLYTLTKSLRTGKVRAYWHLVWPNYSSESGSSFLGVLGPRLGGAPTGAPGV